MRLLFQCVYGVMPGIFSGINKFDLQNSSATKIKSKVVGVSLAFSVLHPDVGLHCLSLSLLWDARHKRGKNQWAHFKKAF